ncbi:hypothetical protein HWV62_33811 [Athelia sp. TMB]|nr:hypothetical protein HWV62_33811 [Athelia sp. TMB]
MAANFSTVPTLDYALVSDPARRPEFVSQLQHALINVGFLYLKNPPVSPKDVDDLIRYIPHLFALPQEAKDEIRMANSPHFLGYSKLGAELTKGETDHREQFDFATPHTCRWTPGAPDYLRLWGPSQWPEETALPGFKSTMERYLAQVQALGYKFIEFLAEAFGLSHDALSQFYNSDKLMQHRAKVCNLQPDMSQSALHGSFISTISCDDHRKIMDSVYLLRALVSQIAKYPAPTDEIASNQGLGPHYDGGFLTFLLQASDQPGLQVQNLGGQWIDVPPIPGTFVVNIGKGLARATSHRVLSPVKGSTPRYSVPFFQTISLDTRLADQVLECKINILTHRHYCVYG